MPTNSEQSPAPQQQQHRYDTISNYKLEHLQLPLIRKLALGTSTVRDNNMHHPPPQLNHPNPISIERNHMIRNPNAPKSIRIRGGEV